MQTSPKRKKAKAEVPARAPDVLDVHGAAALLTVSADTVYDLFAKGELPGRKVGRKWITTKAAVLRWIENTSGDGGQRRAAVDRARQWRDLSRDADADGEGERRRDADDR